MSRISSCAACHGDIMIPGFAQPQDQMRCPLCNAPFLVQDVLATSIQAPPEAIRVEQTTPLVTAPLVTSAVGPRLSCAEEPGDLAAEIDSAAAPAKKTARDSFAPGGNHRGWSDRVVAGLSGTAQDWRHAL